MTSKIDLTSLTAANLQAIISILKNADFKITGGEVGPIYQEFQTLEMITTKLSLGKWVVEEAPTPDKEED